VSFMGWTFLFGAVAVVGPIVAHLLAKPKFRRVPFTMLQFLRAGRHESHSRRKLRDLLVLLMRCAIVVLIAVLFARPMLKVPAAPRTHRTAQYVALDDSASMAYRDGRSRLFERMIEQAVDRVRRAPEDASFAVFGMASGRLTHGLNKGQAIAEIKRLNVVPRSARPTEFVQALRQAQRAALPGDTISAAVFSDFTPGVLREFERVREPAIVDALAYEIVAPASPVSNAGIVDARAIDVVDNKLDLDVVVANSGGVEQRRKLVLKGGGTRRPVSVDVAVAPGERRVVRMQMDLGLAARATGAVCLPVELSLEPGDGLSADDSYRLAVCIPRTASTRILLVGRGDEAFLFETAIQALAGQGPVEALTLRRARQDRPSAADLGWADVIVFSSLPTDFSYPTGSLKGHLARGGRLIFFATESGNPQVLEQLSREGLLAAVPQKWVEGIVYPEPQPAAGGGIAFGEQAARALANYRFDRIAMKGYWSCRVPQEAQPLWRFANGEGFVYGRPAGSGSTILVNTSIDGSLGLLARSGAWVAFYRFLVGEADRVRQFCFRVDERPVLHLPDSVRVVARGPIEVEHCDGSRGRATVEGTRVVLPAPQGTGWMKTLGEPTLHAGINLPEGETDLRRPTAQAVADAVQRAFVTDRDRERDTAHASLPTQTKPLWKAFAWAAILLLLLEPAMTNRLKR
jgi:hypothetical protein